MSEAFKLQFKDGERKYRRLMYFLKAGDHVVNHQHHNFDHTMRVERGTLEVKIKNEWKVLNTEESILVPAKTEHEARALADDTVAWYEFELRPEVPNSEAWF